MIDASREGFPIASFKLLFKTRFLTDLILLHVCLDLQIYKQFLTNKVLSDPRQRRFFKPKDIRDLFTLGDDGDKGTETGDLFAGTAAEERTAVKKEDGGYEQQTSTAKTNESAADDNDQTDETGNANLLNSLLDDSGEGVLHSTINHDAILKAGTDGGDDKLFEYEADKIAAKAVEEVNRSAQRRRRENVGVPTWTGRSGLAGFVNSRPANGAGGTAASLLQKIKQREGTAAAATSNPDAPDLSTSGALLRDIIHFLRDHGGQSASAEMVQHFQARVDSIPNGLQGFKSLLKKVAILKKGAGPNGSSAWKLLSKFATDD